jgi:fumarylacetoacetase
VPDDSPFGVHALPYGVFATPGESPRVGVRVGDHVLDVAPVAATESLDGAQLFEGPSLDALMAAGRPAWDAVRGWLTELLTHPAHADLVGPYLVPLENVRMHRPFTVADYVDFYSNEHHATNVGRIFRPDDVPLHASWKHLPVGYHGRAGTVVPSGADVVRPCGQRRSPDGRAPTFGPTRTLDIEAEVGFVVGKPSPLGTRVPSSALADHVFGVVLVNDWSARDVQSYESVPLGPFLGKSFATSISTWVLPLAALGSARVPPPRRDVPLAEHLADDPDEPWGLDLALEIVWNGTVVSQPPFATTYWTAAQQLAHLTSNGASLRTGDLFASGTVSGPERGQRGSFLELSWNGAEQVRLADGSLRTFLEDGDTVTVRATAPGPGGVRVGLGDVTGRVLPAT